MNGDKELNTHQSKVREPKGGVALHCFLASLHFQQDMLPTVHLRALAVWRDHAVYKNKCNTSLSGTLQQQQQQHNKMIKKKATC